MMKKIRIGNDIPLVWKFYYPRQAGDTEWVPYDLTGRNITIEVSSGWGVRKVMEHTVDGNAVSFTFHGRDQRNIGEYTLTMIENNGAAGMHTIDKITPFLLVARQEVVESGTLESPVSVLEVQPLVLESHLHDGGVSDYEALSNKPQINGVTLEGNRTGSELGLEHPYISLERLRKYLYRVTFDTLPEDNGGNSPVPGGCSSYVKDGRLYRNLDFKYDNAASFIVRTRDFEGMSFITGLNDGELTDELIAQLPYRMVDGRNNHGIKVSTHVLFNDWSWTGAGDKSIALTRLPYLVLSRVKSMATIAADLDGVLGNLYAPEAMGEYLLQVLVTDGTATYAILPPLSEGQGFVLQDITDNPKLTNFRWLSSTNVTRADADLQDRPTGIERFNLMPCDLSELRFTKAYETADRLSEFIGIDGTTKESTDEELEAIYDLARAEYLARERDGKTWQTMHSVVYGDRLESLYIQENWEDDCIWFKYGIPVADTIPADGLLPNVVYNLGELSEDLNVVLQPPVERNINNEYRLIFSTGETVCAVHFPTSLRFMSKKALMKNTRYEVIMQNGYAIMNYWDNSPVRTDQIWYTTDNGEQASGWEDATGLAVEGHERMGDWWVVTFSADVEEVTGWFHLIQNYSNIDGPVQDIKLPQSIRRLLKGAFKLDTLRSINIPAGIEVIDDDVFSDTQLQVTGHVRYAGSEDDGVYVAVDNTNDAESVEVIDGTIIIARGALGLNGVETPVLTEVSLPGSVKRIDAFAFRNQSALVSLNLSSMEPPKLDVSAFDDLNLETLQIHVPYRVYEEYRRADGWKEFADNITAD